MLLEELEGTASKKREGAEDERRQGSAKNG
jgi:hypothetical protein